MTIRVATVLSARDWEPGLVAHARETADLRIVVRAFQPSDIDRHDDDIDVIVAAGEVSWVTASDIIRWRRRGHAVVGVAPAGDGPAKRLLTDAGADEVVPDTIEVAALVQAIRFAAPRDPAPSVDRTGHTTAIVGARGAPGCTEVAIAFATGLAQERRTVLVDLDAEGPSVAIRLGVPARPDIVDVLDSLRADGTIGQDDVHDIDGLSVITGVHRFADDTLRIDDVELLLRACRAEFAEVVIDAGCRDTYGITAKRADDSVLVVDASATGIVRAARLTERWVGPPPALVLNRVRPGTSADLVEAVRRWTGLEPAVVIPERNSVRRASVSALKPDRRFTAAVQRLSVS